MKAKKTRWIDLSFPIREGMTTYPSHWHPPVSVTRLARHGVEKRETRKLVLGTHSGTHVDAPLHFVKGGPAVDSFPPELMMGPAGLIDFMPAKARKEYGLAEIRAALGRRKVMPRMLVRFGWTGRYGPIEFYTESPYLSTAACLWLAERGMRLLGVDVPSIDSHDHGYKSGNDAPNHHALLSRGLFLTESLANLDKLSGGTVRLMVFPLNILGGDGAPARCFASAV